MRVFVTGATGFVGSAVVKELISAGHKVLGLSRSEKGAQQLKLQGAESLHGVIEDIGVLRRGASACDAVIHLAFVHDFANFAASCATDRAAISEMGSTLAAAGGNRAFVVTSGTGMLASGRVGTEDDPPDMENPMAAARGPSESLCLDFAKQGVRSSIVRLPPTTHGMGASGFVGPLVAIAMQKGVSAYVNNTRNHWSAGHRDDAAKLYRLAMEKGEPGSVFHAVGEEGVLMKDIATEIGKQLEVPVIGVAEDGVEDHFGWFKMGVMLDNQASSAKTREQLGWSPTGPTVMEDVPFVIDFMRSQNS